MAAVFHFRIGETEEREKGISFMKRKSSEKFQLEIKNLHHSIDAMQRNVNSSNQRAASLEAVVAAAAATVLI